MHTTRRSACVSKKIFYMLNHSRWMHLRRFFCLIHVRRTKPRSTFTEKRAVGAPLSSRDDAASMKKKRTVGAVFAGDLGLNSAPEYMKAWKMNWWRWWCFRIWNVKDAAGVSKGLFCRSQPQRTFKRKDVHQYLLQKALAQSHTGFCLYVQDALTLCTRTSLLAAQESDFFLYLNPDPLRNLQHSYKQINKKPKLRIQNSRRGSRAELYIWCNCFFLVKVSPDEIEQK